MRQALRDFTRVERVALLGGQQHLI